MDNSIRRGDPAIRLDCVSKIFGTHHAVSEVSLDVNRGEIYGFIGLNGAGKSTVIRMMLSLLKPTSGTVYLLGSKVDFGSYGLWKSVGFLEKASFYAGLTVEENLDIARRMQLLPDRQCISDVMQTCGLEPNRKTKVENLSLGNKQRLGLAKAMIHKPEILILDEPINGLDPAGVAQIRHIILDLSKKSGVTVFLSSHLLGELSKSVDRIGVIHEGRLVQEVAMSNMGSLLKRALIIGGRDQNTMKKVLSEHGYQFETDSEGRFVLSDHLAIEEPEKINELLVRSGQAPSELRVAAEDLEGYFLRLIGTTEGA
jgi:ABC-2 type transport system ATP-binding protein